MEKNRNYFIAIGLSVLIVLAWQFLYMNPRIEAQRKAEAIAKAQQHQTEQTTPANAQTSAANTAASGALPAGQAAPTAQTLEEALAKTPRVTIDTAALSGSINLAGARLDDLKLKGYRETVDKTSPIITLFSPAETKDGYFTELGYIGGDNSGATPGPATVWKVASGDKLTEKTPVTLSYTNDKGITFNRTISVDEHYMFTIADKISNGGQQPVSLSSYGRVIRYNKPLVALRHHEGFIGVIGEDGLLESKYAAVEGNVEPAKAQAAARHYRQVLGRDHGPPQTTAYNALLALHRRPAALPG